MALKKIILAACIVVFAGCTATWKTKHGNVDFILYPADVEKILDFATRFSRGDDQAEILITTRDGMKVLIKK